MIGSHSQTVLDRLLALDFVRSLSARCVDALVREGTPKHVAKGQWLYMDGDQQTRNGLIVEGLVGHYVNVNQSKDALMEIHGPGYLLGMSCYHHTQQAFGSAIARTPTTLWVINRIDCPLPSSDLHELYHNLRQLQAHQTRQTTERSAQRKNLGMPARLAAELKFLSQSLQTCTIEVTQDELAELIGVTRKTINHWLHFLRDCDVVDLSYRGVVIGDAPTLARLIDR